MTRARVFVAIGDRSGHLTVVENNLRFDTGHWGVLVECDCGKTCSRTNGQFRNRTGSHKRQFCSRDCGLRWKSNDKGIGTAEGFPGWYRSYNAMKQRCLDPKCRSYKDYGGRGIKICERWLENPLNFFEDMGHRPEGMTIDRKDVDGDYHPDNCKWASSLEQARNKRK